MSADKLAKRYAKAIFDDVLVKGTLEAVNKDMQLLEKTVEDSKELKVFLKNPIIKSAKKVAVLTQLFGGKVSDEALSMIHLLIEKGREGYLGDIAGSFNRLYNEYNNILEVKITTAVPLDNATEELVKKAIYSKVGNKQLIINATIDPDILGGFIIDLGNKVFDASLRNKLSNIANELIYN